MSKPRAASAPAAHGDTGARKRSTSPTLFRRAAAAITALVLGAGLALVGLAAPASAHTGDLKASAVCNTATGEYDVTYTLKLTNVPNNKTGTTKWRVGDTDFDGTPTSAANLDRGPISTNGNATIELGTEHLAGDTQGYGPWVYAYTTWPGSDKGSDGRLTTALEGDCAQTGPVVKKIEFCHATGSETHPYERIETAVEAFFSAGHDAHQNNGDIYPAFSYLKHGKVIHVPAQGDQSLLQYEDCVKPLVKIPVEGEPTFSDACGPDNEVPNLPGDTEKIDWNTVEASGVITVTATAKPGYAFQKDAQTTWTFTIDDAPCIEPSLRVAAATGTCVADAPWIFYDIELADPDHQSTGNTARLVLTDGTNTETIELGELDGGKLKSKVLWPGASVAADGVTPTGWPGWALVGTTWVQVDDNFAWTRGDIQATVEVNPTAAVTLSYPPATPECATGPKASGSGGSPAAAGTGLASTGFAGTTIAIVAGIIVVAGIAFLVIARIRRKRA
ncbi:hypothetical protein [Agromyces ramosus]|uniref:LPXTG-motif cell wall-anchored protein n=1 Tax=Agromyces ramosus TaxID=33879 RepID=A0ABU0RCT8_9MICO|nr:hypothetical protein [Agromyces ramosus]MDQ0895602.1 hypothetical protein [Agromyces ramosus]